MLASFRSGPELLGGNMKLFVVVVQYPIRCINRDVFGSERDPGKGWDDFPQEVLEVLAVDHESDFADVLANQGSQ